jgi:hypothetical protein
MNRVYPAEIVDRLIDWCAEHATQRPWPATIVGLSYGYTLSRHQILSARRLPADRLTIEFAAERGRAGARLGQERCVIPVVEPDWLVDAIGVLTTGERPALLLQPTFIGKATASTSRIQLELRRASVEATGFELSPEMLCRTGIVHAQDRGIGTFNLGVGYKPAAESLIAHDLRQTVMPFKP